MSAFAQKTKTSLKLYLNAETGYSSVENMLINTGQTVYQEKIDLRFGRFSPAIAFMKKKYYFEVEFSKIDIGSKDEADLVPNNNSTNSFQVTGGSYEINFDIAARAEIGIDLLQKNKLINPMIGIAAQPYLSTINIQPNGNPTLPTYTRANGMYLQIIPRFRVYSKDRIDVELNGIFYVWNLGRIKTKITDPGFNPNEEVDSVFVSNFFPGKVGARLGVSYQL